MQVAAYLGANVARAACAICTHLVKRRPRKEATWAPLCAEDEHIIDTVLRHHDAFQACWTSPPGSTACRAVCTRTRSAGAQCAAAQL
jgi:hypothetical protein